MGGKGVTLNTRHLPATSSSWIFLICTMFQPINPQWQFLCISYGENQALSRVCSNRGPLKIPPLFCLVGLALYCPVSNSTSGDVVQTEKTSSMLTEWGQLEKQGPFHANLPNVTEIGRHLIRIQMAKMGGRSATKILIWCVGLQEYLLKVSQGGRLQSFAGLTQFGQLEWQGQWLYSWTDNHCIHKRRNKVNWRDMENINWKAEQIIIAFTKDRIRSIGGFLANLPSVTELGHCLIRFQQS